MNYTFNGHSMEDVSAKRQSNGSLLETTARYYFSERMDVLMGAIGEHVRGDLNSQADGGDYDVIRYNVYAQLDYQFTEYLDFVLGGQWNKQKNLRSNVSPRASILARLSDKWGLKLMYGEAYREAFAFQSFFNVPSFKGNPTLGPELIATYDIQLLYTDVGSSMSLTYFESRISDSHLRSTVNGVTTMENSAEDIESNGAELEFKTVMTSWFQMQGSMLYQQNSDASNEDVLFNPNLMAKIGFTITPTSEYRFSVFNSYFSEAGKIENIEPSVSVVNPPASSYHLLTLQIEWNPASMKNISFSLYGDNLLGEDVYFPDLNRRAVNTIPQRSGQALYATVEFRL